MDAASIPDDLPAFYIGQHETRRSSPVSTPLMRKAQELGYDLITTPITTPQFHSRVLSLLSATSTSQSLDNSSFLRVPQLTSEDTTLLPGDSNAQMIAACSPWIDLCSPDPLIASVSRQVLNMEVAYASFCGFSNLMVSGPNLHQDTAHADGLGSYARAIHEALNVGTYFSMSVLLPMVDQPNNDLEEVVGSLVPLARDEFVWKTEGDGERKGDLLGTWDVWHLIRSVCKYSQRLCVALHVPRHLPPLPVQNRWFAEPLRLLSFPGNCFLTNQSGYPVLSKAHQSLVFRYMRLRFAPWILLADVGVLQTTDDAGVVGSLEDSLNSPTPAEAALRPAPSHAKKGTKDPTPHLNYMRHLQRNQPLRSITERFSSGYQEYLQAPLQPLTDNLESITYEVFEKDPIKYDWYERAIAGALKSWMDNHTRGSGPNSQIVLAVVGAGRGPLVSRSLRAAAATGANLEIWAVEKNPNAYVLLQHHNRARWESKVNIVCSDMRSWKGPRRKTPGGGRPAASAESTDVGGKTNKDPRSGRDASYGKVDILVSELLGSFGDNELSPECLDGAEHLLNSTDGISIPASYTAHLTPIAAPRLHADVKSRAESDPTAPETPYVVMLHAYSNLSTSSASSAYAPIIQQAWEFSHPSPSSRSTSSQAAPTTLAPEEGTAATLDRAVSNQHNARSARLAFPCSLRGACDGLAGYFEATLWGDVELSIRPDRIEQKSADMTSWFPIFFPLKTPLYFPDNSILEVLMWRQTDDRKVWYEWLVEVYLNQAGQKIRLGCSELHSSIKAACLM